MKSRYEHVVVSGCSFTTNEHVPDGSDWNWCNILAKDTGMRIHNLATAGAGNKHISTSIRSYLARHPELTPSNTLVMAMWSGVGRIDMLASSDLCKDQGYPNCFYDEHNRICKGGHWWHRGRPGSTLSLADETIRSISKLQDDYSFTLASWLEMTALEDYVAARGFTYRCTSFVDFEQNRIKGDALVVPFHRCLAELNLTLDRKNWLPLRGEDYFGDWCRERKLLVNDGFHPGLDGPYRWPREVVMPILLAQGILYDI